MTPSTIRRVLFLAAALASVCFVGAADVSALQSPALGQQNLRPYWHVFAAYAIVIILIGGWVASIGRRLRQVEDRLVD